MYRVYRNRELVSFTFDSRVASVDKSEDYDSARYSTLPQRASNATYRASQREYARAFGDSAASEFSADESDDVLSDA